MDEREVTNFEQALREASQAEKAAEAPAKPEVKSGYTKAAEATRKVSADATAQTKKIVAAGASAFKKGLPVVAELWKKTVAFVKKLASGKKFSLKPLVKKTKALLGKISLPGKGKKLVYLAAGGAIVLAVAITGLVRLEVLTVTQGIELTDGAAKGRSVLVDKFAEVQRGDLIVGILPGTEKAERKTIMGSIFSQNAETYALYDGEVIWQLPVKDLIGKALFLEPKKKL